MSAKAALNRPGLVILIAEDDPNDVLLMKRAFARAGVEARLIFVHNGQEAISYLQGQAPYDNRAEYPYPHLLFLDFNMPGINGLEVLQWLASRPEPANLTVIVFSSSMAPADCRQAAMLGAHSCVSKPLDPGAIIPMLAGLSGFSGPEQLAGQSGELSSPTAQ